MTQVISFEICDNPPARLDKALARDVPEEATLSRSRLSKLIDAGAVSVDGTVTLDPRMKVHVGALVEIEVEEAQESHIGPEDIPLDIVFEDANLIVLNKPAGMVVHPAPGTPSGTLVNALIHHCGDDLSGVGGMKRPGIVAHQGLAAQFADHSVERRYLAICYGVPDSNEPRVRGVRGVSFEAGNIMKVQSFLGRHRTDRQRQAVSFDKGRHAVTRVRVVERFGRPEALALVECWLETGRTHQIRVHMAHVGHSLVGDPTYGGRRKLSEKALGALAVTSVAGFSRQALHAATLGFEHPISGEVLEFEAEMPGDMAQLLVDLSPAE